ncbi:hypothetical protein [Barthadenovirus sternae]|nr:hypothetical protein [Tern adenovirus]UJZ92522.1 hypothetical protein [Tern atadenovirus 1]
MLTLCHADYGSGLNYEDMEDLPEDVIEHYVCSCPECQDHLLEILFILSVAMYISCVVIHLTCICSHYIRNKNRRIYYAVK